MEYYKMSTCSVVINEPISALFCGPLTTKNPILEVKNARYLLDLTEFLLLN
jgi:hypothetical protein